MTIIYRQVSYCSSCEKFNCPPY